MSAERAQVRTCVHAATMQAFSSVALKQLTTRDELWPSSRLCLRKSHAARETSRRVTRHAAIRIMMSPNGPTAEAMFLFTTTLCHIAHTSLKHRASRYIQNSGLPNRGAPLPACSAGSGAAPASRSSHRCHRRRLVNPKCGRRQRTPLRRGAPRQTCPTQPAGNLRSEYWILRYSE